MGGPLDSALVARLRTIAASSPGLSLLVLYGSRATGSSHAMSDWDLAFLADGSVDLDDLTARLAEALLADRLPARPEELVASIAAADAVILHLWQATQIVIDLAVAACVAYSAGTPQGYGDAFRRLQAAGIIEPALADRLVRAAGFRNVVAHAYEQLDLRRVHRAATDGPADLLAPLRSRSPTASVRTAVTVRL